jgi:hypothetical protein
MSSVKLASAALAVSVLFGSAAVPRAEASQPCVFEKYAPTAFAPYKVDNGIDFGSYSFVGGAQLFVPAREGLTREWLAASVQRALDRAAAGTEATSCDGPRVKGVTVQVVSGGTGFWVQLISPDPSSSETLLKWAQGITAKAQQQQAERGQRHASR